MAGGDHQRAALFVDVHFESGYGEQTAFDGCGDLNIAAHGHRLHHQTVDIRAVWLHDIVGQAIGVVAVMVMDAEGWEHAATHESSRYYGAQYGIAIVEQGVGVYTVAAACEVGDGGEHLAPIEGSGASLKIGAVAGKHLFGPLAHVACLDAVQLLQQGCLV